MTDCEKIWSVLKGKDGCDNIDKVGKWIVCSDGYYPFCSVCGAEPKKRRMTNRCQNCGAKMEVFCK